MLPYAAFHLGLHCFQSTCLHVSRTKRVNILCSVDYLSETYG